MGRYRDDDESRGNRTSRALPGTRRAEPRDEPPGERMAGVVTKHFPERGFGFIREDASGREYFFHRDGTEEGTVDGFLNYSEGTPVTFEGRSSIKGFRAFAIKRDISTSTRPPVHPVRGNR